MIASSLQVRTGASPSSKLSIQPISFSYLLVLIFSLARTRSCNVHSNVTRQARLSPSLSFCAPLIGSPCPLPHYTSYHATANLSRVGPIEMKPFSTLLRGFDVLSMYTLATRLSCLPRLHENVSTDCVCSNVSVRFGFKASW